MSYHPTTLEDTMDTQPGQYGPTGRCLTCDSRQCPPSGCLNGDADVDDAPEADALAFLNA